MVTGELVSISKMQFNVLSGRNYSGLLVILPYVFDEQILCSGHVCGTNATVPEDR